MGDHDQGAKPARGAEPIDAIVLAGSPNTGKLKEASPAAYEAFIEIAGRPMVDYVVQTLLACPSIGRIAIAGPQEELGRLYRDRAGSHRLILAPGGETLAQTGINAIQALQPKGLVLAATSDIPLLTPPAVEDFISQCQKLRRQMQGNLFYAVVPREDNEALYPGVKRTYVNLRGLTVTGGNIFLLDPEIIPRALAAGEELIALRKEPFKMAQKVGIGFIIKFILRLASLQEAEQKFSGLLGVRGRAVISHYPEIGIDVDKPSDLELAIKALAQPSSTP